MIKTNMKLIITESQYNRLFLKEEKESDNFSFDKETVMAFAKVIGLPLKGQNEFSANRAVNNKDTISMILSILKDANKREEMVKDLESKGLSNANDFIVKNSEKIITNFNKHAEEVGLDERLTLKLLLNNVLRK
jgi:hypothetical protein